MQQHVLKWRSFYKGVGPRKIKLEVPGFSGEPGYKDGAKPQPWHCKPYVDASTYGLELVYQFQHEAWVIGNSDGSVTCESSFTDEEKNCGVEMPPFSSFAPNHYGFTSSLDILTEPGSIIRVEPHPRFYSDRTNTCPIPVAGHLESDWWPRIFFVVFKSPLPGEMHVFRHGEPYAQIIVIPRDISYDIQPMSKHDIAKRAVRDEYIVKFGNSIHNHSYKDSKGNQFDNKYKVLSKAFRRSGDAGIDDVIKEAMEKKRKDVKKIAKMPVRKHEGAKTQQEAETVGLHAVLGQTPADSGGDEAGAAEGPAPAAPKCPFAR